MSTLRQQMIAVLQAAPTDRRGLSQALGISEKEVDSHLPHVAKSVVAKGMAWQVTPAFCINCSYTFKERKRLSSPGKCPRCRHSRIQGPWFKVSAQTSSST
ncbi:MAG: transcriptional regulator [Desulfobacteraceae bacterium]